MQGLLKKILLWFSVAMVVIVLAIFLTVISFENGPLFSAVRSLVRTAVTLYGHQVVSLYERDGAAAANEFLRNLQAHESIQIALFDQQAQPLTDAAHWGRDAEIQGLIAKAFATDSGAYRLSWRMTNVATVIHSPQGRLYCIAGKLPASYIQNWRLDSRAFLWRFLVGITTAVIVCYLLARSLTQPIVQLRQATRSIAAGDLGARVLQEFETRNDEIGDLAKDFNLMADRIAALLVSQRRLLGDISHELRSPLTRLNIALALARQQTGEIAAAELDRIEREAERLNNLISQLLELTRVESGAVQMANDEISVLELLEDIVADADFEARNRQRSVVLVTPPKFVRSVMVRGSAALLRSAIENVVRNAVRYTASGTAVRLEVTLHAAALSIAVCDHGPGVPAAALDKLFQPFYRVSEARDRDSGGTGLGLAITARGVSLFAGSVSARNLPEGGLCVEIHLPLSASSKTPTA